MPPHAPRPTKAQLAAAHGRRVPDLIRPGLRVLFCGINPGLYSAAVAHHFARPGNRFWPALHGAGFTDRLLAPHEEAHLLAVGCGITNIVDRATARADELTPDELAQGVRRLAEKARRYRPRCIAVLGVTAYRTGFGHKAASLGPQPHALGPAQLWVLPNPSGLNAHYQMPDLIALYADLRRALASISRP